MTITANTVHRHCSAYFRCTNSPDPHNPKLSVAQACLTLFKTPWTVAHQGPLSVGFSRQEYWSGLPFPFPGDLPDPGIEPESYALQADSLPSEPQRGNALGDSSLRDTAALLAELRPVSEMSSGVFMGPWSDFLLHPA